MIKSIARLAIAILIIDAAVLDISFVQQTGKLTAVDANITSIEGGISTMTGEAAALQGNISNLQAGIRASEANSTALQDALDKANAVALKAQQQIDLPPPAPAVDPNAPAAFVVSDLRINETLIQPWDVGTVTVMVTNTGGQTGNYTAVLILNGATWATQSLVVAGGQSAYAIFGVQPNKEIHAVISVGNLTVEADWLTH